MTYSEICRILREAGIDECAYEARLICQELGGGFDILKDYDREELLIAVNKRAARYPLQYILGKWWLANCTFEVNEDCLIPRQDTELIIELARDLLPENAAFADLCTGSGCIAISVLELRSDTRADACELYPKTLELAVKNAEINGVSARFAPVLGDVLKKETLKDKKYSAIISNPPYIESRVVKTLEKEVMFEPSVALDGGEDGLVFYRAIVENFADNLEEDGFFLFEIGYDQADSLKEIASLHGFDCKIYKDLGKNDRAALLTRNSVR